jgi:hypothetical protein
VSTVSSFTPDFRWSARASRAYGCSVRSAYAQTGKARRGTEGYNSYDVETRNSRSRYFVSPWLANLYDFQNTYWELIDGGSSCSALRLRSKNDLAHVKPDIFSVEFTADFWYLSVVTGANEHQSRPPAIIHIGHEQDTNNTSKM